MPSRRHAIPPEAWPSADQAAAARLFQPLGLPCGLTLRDRTWIPAMVPWRASDEGFVTPSILDWYRRFAEGRPGVLVVEATGIRDIPSGPLLRIGHDRFVPGLTDLVAAVRTGSAGHTRLFIQIIDFLSLRRRPERSRYLAEFLQLTDSHRHSARATDSALDPADDRAVRTHLADLDDEELREVLSPREWEDLQQGHRERVTDVHLPHIQALPSTLPGLFADAAERAQRAGFDGVELHYAHAYTMASFLSRRNDRKDGYGGSTEGRIRLPLEVLAAVRARVGRQSAVGCRLLGDESIEGGSDLSDACSHAVQLAAAGIDYLSISRGGKFEDARQPRVGHAAYPYTGPSGAACMPSVYDEEAPFGRNLSLAAGIRRAVRDAGHGTPVVASGGINSFSLAERALADGHADAVAAARQSLADPDWFLKIRTGRGDEIQRCLYTNYCEALDQQHREVTCQLWDRLDCDPSPRSTDGRRRLIAPRGPWTARVRPS
jgi:2,4-dienoyl-CoA reductase-like NADH-dependent reductase (Old Yellow Enzyme family)